MLNAQLCKKNLLTPLRVMKAMNKSICDDQTVRHSDLIGQRCKLNIPDLNFYPPLKFFFWNSNLNDYLKSVVFRVMLLKSTQNFLGGVETGSMYVQYVQVISSQLS